MADRKTANLMLRIQPTLKQTLRELAAREHRSLSNMIEVLILDYDRRHGPASLENLPDDGRFKDTA
jgi:hypothetical protein